MREIMASVFISQGNLLGAIVYFVVALLITLDFVEELVGTRRGPAFNLAVVVGAVFGIARFLMAPMLCWGLVMPLVLLVIFDNDARSRNIGFLIAIATQLAVTSGMKPETATIAMVVIVSSVVAFILTIMLLKSGDAEEEEMSAEEMLGKMKELDEGVEGNDKH